MYNKGGPQQYHFTTLATKIAHLHSQVVVCGPKALQQVSYYNTFLRPL